MRRKMNSSMISAAALLFAASAAHAQLTWDVVPGTVGVGDGSITHSNGLWDAFSGNWTADGGANNVAWSSGSDAVFGNNVSNTTVTVDIEDAGVTVGDITLEPGNAKVSFRAVTDNIGAITVDGSATWNTGGRELEILGNNNADDVRVLMSSSNDILTVVGGGTFDAGEKQQNANWVLNEATLDVADAMAVRGNANNVGQFGTIKLADGATYIHERNANQTYGVPDWDLGSGVVTFANRFTGNGSVNLSGVVSGSGTWVIACNSTRWVRPINTNNTFSGTYIVGTANKPGAELLNYNGDLAYGPVPAAVVPNYFTLVNGGELKLNGFEIHANRGITLDGKGVIINNTGPTVYGGKITGDGQLQVGRNEGSDGNTLNLTSNTHDYTGGTRIWQGSLTLQIDDTLPADGVLTLGGGSKNSHFRMNGFDQTVGGLNLNGGNTRSIWNNSTTNSTLTINVADGANYDYAGANIAGSGQIHLVKDGLGTQRFGKDGYTTQPASLTVNDGILAWNSGQGPSGLTTVNSGAVLAGIGTLSADVIVNAGGGLEPGNPNGGNNTLKFESNLDISGMVDDNAGGLNFSFGALLDRIVVTNGGGTGTFDMDGPGFFDLGFSDFTFADQNGLTNQMIALIVADSIVGSLDPTDLTGPVGNKGATGELSLSGNTIWLTITEGDYSPYGEWALGFGLEAGSELDDTDGDSYDNLSEYAFGGNPTNAADIGNAPVGGEAEQGGTNFLTIAFGVQNSDSNIVAYSEKTDSLTVGTWTGDGVVELGTSSTNGFDYVTNGIPLGGDVVEFLGVFVEKD